MACSPCPNRPKSKSIVHPSIKVILPIGQLLICLLQFSLFKIPLEFSNLTSVYYGSRSNIPNEETVKASGEIYRLITSLGNRDSLIVVITGGGSALLCLPAGDVTLGDIVDVTSSLSAAGASINELNIVRRQLDVLKGGGMALLSNAHNVGLF